ncbi:hypothetical protein GCM10007891_27080 [Methylophaga thalassica]|uniref:Tetratricopeptide repeat protein n=3 Tax=Piscirickettsiaceae TaxID=135616 RepID=A0ABQ5TXY0_9GAMM|nr:hypothetical protein GCM10007891_27080 [Methylophaga thalassica]
MVDAIGDKMHIKKKSLLNAVKLYSHYYNRLLLVKTIRHSIKIKRSGRFNMDSTKSFMMNVGQHTKYFALIGLTSLITACAATPAQQSKATVDEAQKVVKAAPEVKEEKKPEVTMPMSPELMYYILTAEVAGQRGEVGAAVELYERAADMVKSPKLAGRSAQVATLSRNEEKINHALDRWLEVDPNNADVYMMRAPFLMMEKDYDGAVQAINKALSLAPENQKLYLARATENLAEVASPEEALATLKKLDLYKQGHPDAHYAYARLAFFYQQYPETLAEIDPLLKADPENESYLVLKADTLQRLGKTKEGVKLLAKPAAKDDASDELRFTYGKLLGDDGQLDKARTIFESIQADNPENRDVLFALGLLALEEKDGEKAKSYFSDLLRLGDPTNQAAYFMGIAEELNANVDAALVWFASVPVQSSRFDLAQTHYINLLLGRDDIDKAREHLAQLRQQLPNKALQYYLFEASLLRDHGMKQEAFDLLTKAIKHYPKNEDALYSRAMIAESMDRLDVLEADLRQILANDPNNSQALNALGYTLTDRTDRHQEALKLIQRALELKPGDPFYLDSLGWVYYRLGDLEKAEKYLREATEANPDSEFIAHLGEVLWQRGKKQEAKKIWDKGLLQDPDNTLLIETMRRFGL